MSPSTQVEPEWANFQQVYLQFGLPRTTLLKLAASGRIRSVSLKIKEGSRRGVRLFEIDSIRALLAQNLP